MGQAKNRGTYEQRVAQAKQREADRVAAAEAVEHEKVLALVKQGEDPDVARRIVRGGGRRRVALSSTLLAALALAGTRVSK